MFYLNIQPPHLINKNQISKNNSSISTPNSSNRIILNNLHELSFQKYNYMQSVSFKGNYTNLMKDYKLSYGDINNLSATLTSFIVNPKLYIGAGRDKCVYSIPKMSNYVIAHKKAFSLNTKAKFMASKDVYGLGDKYNFGQPIIDNGNGTFVMKRVNGNSYSIYNWPEAFDRYTLNKQLPTRKEAVQFLNSLKELSQMPVEAYKHLTNQIKYLSEKVIIWRRGESNPCPKWI